MMGIMTRRHPLRRAKPRMPILHQIRTMMTVMTRTMLQMNHQCGNQMILICFGMTSSQKMPSNGNWKFPPSLPEAGNLRKSSSFTSTRSIMFAQETAGSSVRDVIKVLWGSLLPAAGPNAMILLCLPCTVLQKNLLIIMKCGRCPR